MLRSTFQSGFLSLFCSLGSDPLQIWNRQTGSCCCGGSGKIELVEDSEVEAEVLELQSNNNISSTFISCPSCSDQGLGVKLPIIVMIVKNMNKYFSFEIEIKDNRSITRRLRANNFQTKPRVKHSICTLPLRMDDAWNQIQMDLNYLCRKAYGTSYQETVKVMVHANCRLRRIFFADRIHAEDEFPVEFRLISKTDKQNG